VLAVALAAGTASLLVPGCKREDASAGALVVTPDPIDFGEVRWGDTPEVTFRIRNRSSRTVTLKDPEIDCACYTIPRPPDLSRIDPGQTVTLTMVLRSTLHKGGLTRKTLVVRSDDPIRPKVDVPVLSTVHLVRTIEPQTVDFGLVAASGDAVEKSVKVRGHRNFRVRVLRASLSPAGRPVDVEVRPADDGAEGGGGSDVVLRTRKGQMGLLSGQVSLDLEVTDAQGEKRTYREAIWVQGEAR
jgi:hypothetical protein